ncbi:tRNA 2'-phosphotransferase 1 isoform X2 [Ambystoma mexicanum]|uniref:tRNA 2'-phosphotransferase 1 isoform X2 n=1 Tax=Ambystoma mexicanum TaxID=8296 RepID=UPI0037E7570F
MDPERDNIGRHPRARRGGGARKHDENSDVRLSKTLSFILRHGAAKVGLQLGSDGFLYVDDILALPQCRAYTTADVLRVVENNNKQRYAVRSHPADGKLQIRANQGHSLQVTDLDLTLLTTDDTLPENAIHGTYLRHWPSIKSRGLSRMSRIHIHMTTHLPTEEEVVSGIRKDCEVAVFIDLPKALSGCLLPLD